MWWLGDRIRAGMSRRRQQKLCERCGLLYEKTNDECPHCAQLDDEHLQDLIRQRASQRLRLGKWMWMGSAALLLLLVLLNG